MINFKFILISSFLMCFGISFSQNYIDDKYNDEVLNASPQSAIATGIPLNIDNTADPRLANLEGNSVFLKQVGDYNTVKLYANTNTSAIELVQEGNVNAINLDYKANAVITDVIQNGDYNQVKDFVHDENQNISLDLIQQGDDLYFERFGVNNITKSLKFKQTEASPTIIVRSFK